MKALKNIKKNGYHVFKSVFSKQFIEKLNNTLKKYEVSTQAGFFNNKASDKEIVELNKALSHVSNLLGAKEKGYRTLTNIGSDGGQEVPHLHYHIFAGEKIGKMVS